MSAQPGTEPRKGNGQAEGYWLLSLLSCLGWGVSVEADGEGGVFVSVSKLGRRGAYAFADRSADVALDLYTTATLQDRAARRFDA